MNLEDCIDYLYDTYNSIDVRCAAYSLKNDENAALLSTRWNSALLVIRFRRDTVEELQKIYGKLLDEIGIIQNDSFRTSFHAFPIHDWDKILKNWNNNLVSLAPGYSVNITPNAILKNEMREPLRNYGDYVNEEWDVYNSAITGGPDIRSILKDQEKNVHDQRFETTSQYLTAFSEIPEGTIANNEKSLIIITAPVFFKMGDVVFEDKKMKIPLKGDASKTLDLTLEFYDFYPNGTPKKIVKREFAYHKPLQIANNALVDFSIDKQFEEDHIDHYFKLVAYKDKLIVAKTEASVRSRFPTSTTITSPFSNVLKQFVSLDEVKKMIFNFDSKAGNHKGSNFERGIVYLMNILGINAVLLGKGYDTIGEESNKISIDILGTYDNETIILGFATIGMPSDTEFARYRMYIGNLQKLDSNKDLNVHPMLFCGLPTSTLHDKAQENGIRLIGKEELENILGLIDEGNIDNARAYLISNFVIPR